MNVVYTNEDIQYDCIYCIDALSPLPYLTHFVVPPCSCSCSCSCSFFPVVDGNQFIVVRREDEDEMGRVLVGVESGPYNSLEVRDIDTTFFLLQVELLRRTVGRSGGRR